MIALPIIPNTCPGLAATYVYAREGEPRDELRLPVIAWDAEGYPLVPGIEVEPDGRLVRAEHYGELMFQHIDDAWRFVSISRPSA